MFSKKDIVKILITEGLIKERAEEATEAILSSMRNVLISGEKVRLTGIGVLGGLATARPNKQGVRRTKLRFATSQTLLNLKI